MVYYSITEVCIIKMHTHPHMHFMSTSVLLAVKVSLHVCIHGEECEYLRHGPEYPPVLPGHARCSHSNAGLLGTALCVDISAVLLCVCCTRQDDVCHGGSHITVVTCVQEMGSDNWMYKLRLSFINPINSIACVQLSICNHVSQVWWECCVALLNV